MGAYVYSRHTGNLLVAERSADEQAVAAALKNFDRDLVLTWEVDQRTGRQVWEVHKIVSQDRPAVYVCAWRNDDLEPLPLSHRLVDKVMSLHAGARDPLPSEDELNARMVAERRRDAEYEIDELARMAAPTLEEKRSPMLHRGPHLLRSRRKLRARGVNC